MHSYNMHNAGCVQFKISADESYQSLKSFLCGQKLTRTFIKRINMTARLQVNGKIVSARHWLQPGDIVDVRFVEAIPHNVTLSDKPIDVIYEDAHILVIAKPHRLLSLPMHNIVDCAAARVANYYQQTNQFCGIHLLTRLDYGTSGLMLFAKYGYIQGLLSTAMITKVYQAEVTGLLARPEQEVLLPIQRMEGHGTKREIAPHGKGKYAHTTVRLLATDRVENTSTVEAVLHTGRTHQIRLHLLALGHPILGDYLYNSVFTQYTAEETTLKLTCKRLAFVHPITQLPLEIDLSNVNDSKNSC